MLKGLWAEVPREIGCETGLTKAHSDKGESLKNTVEQNHEDSPEQKSM